MRLHTSADRLDVLEALRAAGADYGRLTEHGSRTHARAFDVTLTGNSRRRPNDRGKGDSDAYAATWDQWGVFLAHLFDVDSNTRAGWAYKDAEDFHVQTCWRFADGWPADAHGDHRFAFAGVPRHNACTKCSAERVWAS